MLDFHTQITRKSSTAMCYPKSGYPGFIAAKKGCFWAFFWKKITGSQDLEESRPGVENPWSRWTAKNLRPNWGYCSSFPFLSFFDAQNCYFWHSVNWIEWRWISLKRIWLQWVHDSEKTAVFRETATLNFVQKCNQYWHCLQFRGLSICSFFTDFLKFSSF